MNGVDAAGLMLAAPEGDLRNIASSSARMRGLELFELRSREGPCPDCYRTGLPVVNADLADVAREVIAGTLSATRIAKPQSPDHG